MPPIPSPRRRPQTPVELPPLIDDSIAAQDRLVRKAVDEPSLKPKKEDLAARDESDRLWYRQQRLKYGTIVFIVVLIAGGIGWYLYDGQQKQQALLADNAAEQAEQESRMAELAESTRQDVRRLTAALDFGEAREVLQRASAKGLPHPMWIKIDGRISSDERRHGEDLLDQAEREINSDSIEAGNALLAKVEILNLPGDLAARVRQLRQRTRELVHETAMAAGRKLLDDSKSAAEAGEFDRALALLDRAKAADLPSADVYEWESQLREVVGGRVRVLGQPDNALVRVDGVGEAKLGETLAGIKTGTVDVVVIADGHLPESLRLEVSFPNVTEARVNLVPEAAGPLWATAALDGHCSQALAAGFYRSVHSGAAWLPGVDKVVSRTGPCAAESVGGPSSAAEAVNSPWPGCASMA